MKISKYQKRFGVGLLGTIIGLILLGLLWLLDRALHHVEILSQPRTLRIIGGVLLVTWISWHIWTTKIIRSWWKYDKLCTKGPCRFVRHPMYAGVVFLCAVAIALMFNSWILLLWPIIGYPIWFFLVRKEEEMMKTIFGDEYNRYAARTGRLFPRFFQQTPITSVSAHHQRSYSVA